MSSGYSKTITENLCDAEVVAFIESKSGSRVLFLIRMAKSVRKNLAYSIAQLGLDPKNSEAFLDVFKVLSEEIRISLINTLICNEETGEVTKIILAQTIVDAGLNADSSILLFDVLRKISGDSRIKFIRSLEPEDQIILYHCIPADMRRKYERRNRKDSEIIVEVEFFPDEDTPKFDKETTSEILRSFIEDTTV